MVKIICKDISKTYNKKDFALSGVNLSLDLTGIFSLLGRNGAGKTTLVRILSTQLMPTGGSARIDGLDIIKNAQAIRNIIAVTPQEGRPVPWMTPRQSISTYLMWRGFSLKDSRTKAEEAIKLLNIGKYADRLTTRLSGGMKRKVLLATVVASGARILFLDEPTTGLDPISREEIWSLLLDLKKDRLIFLTTHYLEEAEVLADRIGILANGKMMAIGTLAQLRERMGYPYSIKIFDKNIDRKLLRGRFRVISGRDGRLQIFTSEKDAGPIAMSLIRKHIKFSTSPVSLDDIFYHFVKKPIEGEGENYANKE